VIAYPYVKLAHVGTVVLTVIGSVVDVNNVSGPIITWDPRLDPLAGVATAEA
jgi:hypothetical protein